MQYKKILGKMVLFLLMHVALLLTATSSFAATANLAAVRAEWIPPGGTGPIPMWGLVNDTGSCPGPADPPVSWSVGPTIEVVPGDTALTINLRNCLSEPVSVFIPGQYKTLAPVKFPDAQSRERVRSFDMETASGAVGVYEWSSLKEGTYLYHSGTHPQVQVQMGLYGALVVNGTGYPAAARDAVLLYSEIDPALHAAVDSGAYGTPAYPSTFNYLPKYFLINGLAYPETVNIAAAANEDVLLRFVNAGLKTHVPTIQNLYMNVIAEDGNLYKYPMQQYSVQLTAAKTMDAIVNTGTFGTTHALYDRSLHLTNAAATGGGMLTYLVVAAAEICNDLIDNDGDGLADCADPDCDGQACEDGIYCNGIDTCASGSCSIHAGDPCAFCSGVGCICNEAGDLCAGCTSDDDCDGICNPGASSPSCSGSDNCPASYNPGQEDTYPTNANGIGDACDCEGDFNCDGDVDGTDAFLFKTDFGRSIFNEPCTSTTSCNGDFNCDGDVDGSDAFIIKTDFGRSLIVNRCPACVAGTWCSY
jgi:hypothetical protein